MTKPITQFIAATSLLWFHSPLCENVYNTSRKYLDLWGPLLAEAWLTIPQKIKPSLLMSSHGSHKDTHTQTHTHGCVAVCLSANYVCSLCMRAYLSKTDEDFATHCVSLSPCVCVRVCWCVTGPCSRWVAFPMNRNRGSFLLKNESFVCSCVQGSVFPWTDTCWLSAALTSETLSSCCIQASSHCWILWLLLDLIRTWITLGSPVLPNGTWNSFHIIPLSAKLKKKHF